MSERVQILIDGNAVGYASHHREKPIKASNGMEVQAVAGFLYSIRDIKEALPDANIIVLWDGRAWRKDVTETYKANRDPDLASFDPADPATRKRYEAAVKKQMERVAYKKQGPLIARALSNLGVPQVTCFNYEADDLAAYFADRYHAQDRPVRMVTTDADWMQLVQNRVVWKSNRKPFTFVSLQNFHEKTGYKTPECFLEAKILGGDMGDNVTGVPGFGDKTVERFFQTFSGMDEFFTVPRETVERKWEAATSKKPPKPVLALHESGPLDEKLTLNRTLVDLRTPNRPAPDNIKVDRGLLDEKAFLDLCKVLDLYSLAGNLPRFMKTFTGE